MRTDVSLVVFALGVSLFNAALCFSAGPEWGTLKGRVKVQGVIPKLNPLVIKGDGNVRDADCCAAQEIADEQYVIDPETNGLANVVIYLPRRPAKVHPELEKPEDRTETDGKDQDRIQMAGEVKLEQKGCQYLPHVIVARTGQQIRLFNRDPVAHNFHPNAPRNEQPIIEPNNPDGVLFLKLTRSEKTPFKIACDIHPWMSAYCIALDHPYCAVADKTGKFEIRKLPAGKHEFIVWHESMGYIEKKYTVMVDKEMNEQPPLMVEIR